MILLPALDSAVSPCLQSCSFPPRTFFYLSLTSPPGCLPQSIAILVLGLLSSPYPVPTVHTGRPVSLSGVHRAAVQIVCGSHSIQTFTDQLLHPPTASNASPLSQTIPPRLRRFHPCFSSSTPWVQVQSYSLSFCFPFLPSFYHVLRQSMYSFWWLGTPAALSWCSVNPLHLKIYS